MTSTSASKKRLALAIIDFLSTSLKDGTLTSEDKDSVEVAQSCIADTFHVDPSDTSAMQDAIGGQSLLSIYSVYEKLKGKSTASTTGQSSATEVRSSVPSVPAQPAARNPEAEAFKAKGNSAMAAKDYKSAIDFYSKALNVSPLNTIYLSNRAAAYSASGQHAEASTDAEMAVAADPNYTKAWSRLGLARFALGDSKGSMEAYQKGIEYEGNGGSGPMQKGYETAKKRVEEESKSATDLDEDDEMGDAPRGGPGSAGGMPDLSSLAGMFGGAGGGGGSGGGPDLSSIMSNPMFASMAQNLMSNPDMMSNLMSNPRLRQMAEGFSGGGGGAGGEGRGGGGMPDIASLMQDPNIAEMAKNLMGGRGAGRGGDST